MNSGFKNLNLFLFSLMVSLISGCTGHHGLETKGSETVNSGGSKALRVYVDQSRDLLGVNSLLVLPVTFGEEAHSLQSQDEVVYRQLLDAAKGELGLEVKGDARVLRTKEGADALAKRYGTDAALKTIVHRFVEREGSRIGVSKPASLDFSMSVIRASDGKEVWRASYHFKDEALSENLLNVGEKLKSKEALSWETAASTLQSGFRSAYRDLNDKRVSQFTNG